MLLKIKILFTLLVLCGFCICEDIFYNVNSKKILHKTSDKFLSITLDPSVLQARENLSDISFLLAHNLSPAYIRIAGPSTSLVIYNDDEEETTLVKDEGKFIQLTPSVWLGITQWISQAGLTLVFGVNDQETTNGVWNPKSTVPLLDLADKFGVECYWQLGYDCLNKSTTQYVEDLNILKQTLKSFPEHNETWKIVGSDLSTCGSDDIISNKNNLEHYIHDLDENADAIMWQSSLIPRNKLGLTKAALWTSTPKDTRPITFYSATDWAVKVGQAATSGYDVIFREPRLLEITRVTPVYWFSFLYKKLMGFVVLEIKSINKISNFMAFAHCTKKQSDFVRSGAVTLMMINNSSDTASTANVRLGSSLFEKSMEVQSYFLTSNEDTGDVLLNDQPLSMETLLKTDTLFKPKLRRAKLRPHISLDVPPKTIAFFILTSAKYAICSKSEDDVKSIIEEIDQDQDPISEETEFNIKVRRIQNEHVKFPTGHNHLEIAKKNILRDLALNKTLYEKMLVKTPNKANNEYRDNYNRETLHNHLKAFIEKSRKNDLKTEVNRKKEKPAHHSPTTINSLHLTIPEIEHILKRRARIKAAARNVELSSSELDILVDKGTLKISKHLLSKRDINRILLEEKANFYKNNLFNQEMYEQIAKSAKWQPKNRVHPKLKRSIINTRLLGLKSTMEQKRRYMSGRNSKTLERTKRDINLDLLRKRTQPTGKTIISPKLKHQKSLIKDKRTYKHGHSSEELFDDLMQFENKVFEDLISPRDAFSELEMDKSEENFFNKEPSSFRELFTLPQYEGKSSKFPKRTQKLLSFDSDEYIQLLKHSAVGVRDEPCVDEVGYSAKRWSSKTGRKQQPLCTDLDDLNFDDVDYGFFRKKRASNAEPKDKLNDIKKEVEDRFLPKESADLQTIIRRNSTVDQGNAAKEALLLKHKATVKRSLMNNDLNTIFGRYKPLTSALKAWKPVDILNLTQDYVRTLPLYSWVQKNNMNNAVVKNKYHRLPSALTLRRRRYIDENTININQNEISKNKYWKKRGKYSNNTPDVIDSWHKKENSLKKINNGLNENEANKMKITDIESQKIVLQDRPSYFQKVLGKKKTKSIEKFFQDAKYGFNNAAKKIKDFFKNLF